MAQPGKPYHGVPLDVLNFKDFVQKFCPNLRSTTSTDKVNWMNICWIQSLQTRHYYPHTLNETFDEALFQEVEVQAATKKKGRPSVLPSLLSQCYQARLPVSAAKKADYVRLCKKQIIPEDCHEYYNNLTTTHTPKRCHSSISIWWGRSRHWRRVNFVCIIKTMVFSVLT